MRTTRIAAGATALALAGLMASATAASAEPNPPGCPKGNFCAYSGENQTGSLLISTPGNWSGTVGGVRSVFNNGNPDPGADHIQLTWQYSGNTFGECIHYNPGPGNYKINFVGVTVKSATWRGEC
ncbi:peptidase inhibitor family I36 protein [Kitasatospora sp. NPDC054939]